MPTLNTFGSARGFGRAGAARPSAPTINSVTVVNSTTVTINWTAGANNGAPITSIGITSSPSTSLTFTNTDLDGSVNITGTFVNGQAYTFTMTNAVGTSDSSAASNSVTPLNQPTVEYLVVAGGGGGGGVGSGDSSVEGGGGGAGGALIGSNLSLNLSTNYTVTVGAGGNAGTQPPSVYGRATSGSGSQFASITTTGGGYGGQRYGNTGTDNAASASGGNGGSGGGGGKWYKWPPSADGSGGTGTSEQGNNGASPGGGGGKGGAGSGRNGGSGTTSAISGSSVEYAVGGGAGASNFFGGSAGTPNGGTRAAGTSGGSNTGNGGGGAGANQTNVLNGGNGGSGIVIIKYPSNFTITVSGGLTSSETTSGGFKTRTFTAGTGTVSFA